MRVIFLDIDGVLNSEVYGRKMEELHRQLGHTEPASPKHETTCDCFQLYKHVDRDAVVRLNNLVAATAAKIVISSSWRKEFDLPEIRRILGGYGLVGEIIGGTPDGYNDPELFAAFGYIDRIFRGHEIDYWLKKHPEVDRFVILDDGSDMEMHKNRLVQTDCEDGLQDEHVDLAIRMMSWDGKTIPTPFDDLETNPLKKIDKLEAARELEPEDCTIGAGTGLGKYTREVSERRRDRRGEKPGSSAGLHCHEEGCVETLTLERTTTEPPTHEDDYQQLMPALAEAAVSLGWRVFRSVYWCPTHVVAKNLACARCRLSCPACSCLGGSRIDAVEGMDAEGA